MYMCVGAGTFGTVKKGIYRPKSGEKAIECALKCLKPTEELPNQKAEILREADSMANLNHPNIVRLVGKPACIQAGMYVLLHFDTDTYLNIRGHLT